MMGENHRLTRDFWFPDGYQAAKVPLGLEFRYCPGHSVTYHLVTFGQGQNLPKPQWFSSTNGLLGGLNKGTRSLSKGPVHRQ